MLRSLGAQMAYPILSSVHTKYSLMLLQQDPNGSMLLAGILHVLWIVSWNVSLLPAPSEFTARNLFNVTMQSCLTLCQVQVRGPEESIHELVSQNELNTLLSSIWLLF